MNLFNFFKASNKQSREIAKDRLKLVLIHDRGDFSAEKKELIKKDLLIVLSKYMVVDEGVIWCSSAVSCSVTTTPASSTTR